MDLNRPDVRARRVTTSLFRDLGVESDRGTSSTSDRSPTSSRNEYGVGYASAPSGDSTALGFLSRFTFGTTVFRRVC
jgi:hypothetical protein